MNKWLLIGIGAVLGAVAGWLYWYYIGCDEGCTITSSALNSTLYGTVMGGLVMNLFSKDVREPSGNARDQREG